jgi:hypothetical protein
VSGAVVDCAVHPDPIFSALTDTEGVGCRVLRAANTVGRKRTRATVMSTMVAQPTIYRAANLTPVRETHAPPSAVASCMLNTAHTVICGSAKTLAMTGIVSLPCVVRTVHATPVLVAFARAIEVSVRVCPTQLAVSCQWACTPYTQRMTLPVIERTGNPGPLQRSDALTQLVDVCSWLAVETVGVQRTTTAVPALRTTNPGVELTARAFPISLSRTAPTTVAKRISDTLHTAII